LDVFRGRRKLLLLLLLAADCNSVHRYSAKNQEATAAAHQGVLPYPTRACCGGDPYGENEKGEGREAGHKRNSSTNLEKRVVS